MKCDRKGRRKIQGNDRSQLAMHDFEHNDIELTGHVLGRFTREAYDRVTGRFCIIKGPFSPCDDGGRQFAHEAEVLSALAMREVVGLRQCFRDRRRCWLKLDWLPGTNLGRQPSCPARAGWMIARLARILRACHSRGWIHGDICPGNVQVDGQRVWLLDFGAALALGQHYPWRRQVRPEWSSPALLAGEGRVSERDDAYSLMLLACLLLIGQQPPSPSPGSAEFRHWARKLHRPSRLSRRQWSFFRRLLEKPDEVKIQDLAIQAVGW